MSEGSDFKAAMRRELELLTQMRDELRVQMHLAKADLKQEWNKLEDKFERVQSEVQQTGEHAKQPVREMSSAARHLIDELKRGYERIKSGI